GTQKFSKFWNQLIEQELLSPLAGWSNEWYQGIANGNIATLISGAWMAGTLPSGVPEGAGDWRVAPLPTFEKGEKASAEQGGGGDGILDGSENKLVAAAFLKFMNVTDGPAISTKMGFFPAQTDVLESEEFLTAAPEYFGGQEINKIFAQSAEDVVPGWKFLPYNAYAGSIFNDSAGLAYTGKITLQESLEDWGDALKSYGEEQGFTVK
ncbi:MAG: extracellular solute-binding protein, partial [Cryobacterium sp.]|nr:extracellular solute-binding protein [Cryobacterium sp.]